MSQIARSEGQILSLHSQRLPSSIGIIVVGTRFAVLDLVGSDAAR
jgi:hypothetical protein